MIRKKYHSMLVGATISSVINALLLIFDSLAAGVLLGDEAVSAINLTAPIYNLCMFIGLMLSLGIPILYSREMGRFDQKQADRIFGTGLSVGVFGGIMIFLGMTAFEDLYISCFDISDGLKVMLKDYFFWVRFELMLIPISDTFIECIFADGDEKTAFIVGVVEMLTNVISSVILCRFMGIAGIGLGSVIAVVVRLLLSLTHLLRKNNTLHPNLYFSVSIFGKALRYATVDAGNYLSLSLFSFALNLFVSSYFGERMLILVSIILIVQELLLLFDGVGSAITPIISVYLAEKCYRGVRNVWSYALRTAVIEGIIAMIITAGMTFVLPGMLGISDPEIKRIACIGMLLITPGFVFVSILYLISSYYRLIDKIALSVFISVLRDAVAVIPAVILMGMAFGAEGLFSGVAIGSVIAYAFSVFIVVKKYGRGNILLLNDMEKEVKSFIFEYRICPDEIVRNRDLLEQTLKENGIEQKKIAKTMLIFEETLMLIYEKNAGSETMGECAMNIHQDRITLIFRDNGILMDLTDFDMEINSFRSYIAPVLLQNMVINSHHLTAMSFNRNCFEVAL